MSELNLKALFYLFLVVPIGFLFFLFYRITLKDLISLSVHQDKSRISNIYFTKYFLTSSMLLATLVFLILTLSDIRWSKKYRQLSYQGVDIVLAIDISGSMMAEDIIPNRLEKVKSVSSALLLDSPVLRYGVTLFKGRGNKWIPLTEDTESVSMGLATLSPNMLTAPGTDFQGGVASSYAQFVEGKETRKIVFFFSDGGEGDLPGRTEVAKEYNARGIKFIPVISATKEGAVIPQFDGAPVRTRSGEPVRSKVNSDWMIRLAENTGGTVFYLNDSMVISKVRTYINKEIDQALGNSVVTASVPRYRLFLLAAIACFIAYYYLRIRKWGN